MGKKKYYAVVRGRRPGIYGRWYGAGGAEVQVRGYPDALFKGFTSRADAEKFIEEPVILDIVELHDEAYYCWRMKHLYQQPEAGTRRLRKLLARLDDQLQLYYLFFKCDTCTGDKNPAPLKWFEENIPGIEIVEL